MRARRERGGGEQFELCLGDIPSAEDNGVAVADQAPVVAQVPSDAGRRRVQDGEGVVGVINRRDAEVVAIETQRRAVADDPDLALSDPLAHVDGLEVDVVAGLDQRERA